MVNAGAHRHRSNYRFLSGGNEGRVRLREGRRKRGGGGRAAEGCVREFMHERVAGVLSRTASSVESAMLSLSRNRTKTNRATKHDSITDSRGGYRACEFSLRFLEHLLVPLSVSTLIPVYVRTTE